MAWLPLWISMARTSRELSGTLRSSAAGTPLRHRSMCVRLSPDQLRSPSQPCPSFHRMLCGCWERPPCASSCPMRSSYSSPLRAKKRLSSGSWRDSFLARPRPFSAVSAYDVRCPQGPHAPRVPPRSHPGPTQVPARAPSGAVALICALVGGGQRPA